MTDEYQDDQVDQEDKVEQEPLAGSDDLNPELDDQEIADELVDVPESGYALPPSQTSHFAGSPMGLRRGDEGHRDLIDAMAGKVSSLGFGETKVIESAMQAAEDLIHAGTNSNPGSLTELFQRIPGQTSLTKISSVASFAHRDLAIEAAITLARTRSEGKRYRTIALVGSDHGRTGVCRTASGLPSLRDDYGPMMAGFAHVPAGDLEAIKACIDEQTGCILLSPMQINAAARPLDADFIAGVRELCDQHDLLLAMDESEVVFGSCGSLLATTSIVDVAIDLAIVSAGLFAGMPGGLLLTFAGSSGLAIENTGESQADENPIVTAVAAATINELIERDLFSSAAERSYQFAVDIAESIAEYGFVRDLCQLGTSIGIETDIQMNLLLSNASHFGLQLCEAGETAVRMSLPISVSDDDYLELKRRMAETFEATEKQTAAASV